MSQIWEANEFQAATGTEAIAWAVQRHVDFTDWQDEPFSSWVTNLRKRIRSTRHSKRRKPTARLRRKSRPQPPRRRRERSRGQCQTAINLGSLGDSARFSWREDALQRFDNGKAQCEPNEPTEGPTDFPRTRTL